MKASLLLLALWAAAVWAQGLVPPRPDVFVETDLDNDRVPEIVYGSRAGCVHVLKKENKTYQETWASPLLKGPIVSVVVDDIDQDKEPEIIAGTSKGLVVVYSGGQFIQKWDNQFDNLGELAGLLTDDIDGKGPRELVVYNQQKIVIYEGGTYFKRWTSSDNIGAQRVVLGRVDQTSVRQLVTNTGYIIETAYYRVTWRYEPGFGADIWLSDLDGDGLAEVIGTPGDRTVTVFDVDLRSARIR